MVILNKITTRACWCFNQSGFGGFSQCTDFLTQGSNFVRYGIPSEWLGYSFLKFDLSDVLDSNKIVSATLNLYSISLGGSDSGNLYIKRVINDWTTPTWDNKPNTTIINQVSFYSSPTQWISIDITDLIKDIINNINYGISLVNFGEYTGTPDFELDNPYQPYLEIEYNISSTYTISGTTFDDSNNILPNTTIDINGQIITTDENGYYSIIAEPGIYDMVASKEGYVNDSATIEVIDSDITQDFILQLIEECPECPVCPECPPDKLDWWLLLVGGAIGHILKKNDKEKKVK